MCDVGRNEGIVQVPGLIDTSADRGIPEHNGFYASFPFNRPQQSSIHLESFSIQNIMKGVPPTPSASRPHTSSSAGVSGNDASMLSASDAAQGGGGRAAVFNEEPPLNLDERVRHMVTCVMHVTYHMSHVTRHTSHVTGCGGFK